MHIAFATAPGSAHTVPGQPGKTNNQDAVVLRRHARGLVAVLCDGCGSQPHSATGADIGANLIARAILKQLDEEERVAVDWVQVREEVVSGLRAAVAIFATGDAVQDFERAVIERFLFTAMVLVVDGDIATAVSFGDGVLIVDGDVHVIEPPLPNAPPYLGYLLMRKTDYHTEEGFEYLVFSGIVQVKLSELQQGIVIGTDGMKDLVGDDLHHPALVQPKQLQRWLNTQTAERIDGNGFYPGRCNDDVTLVIVRGDEAQARMLQERTEAVQLRQRTERLQREYDAAQTELAHTKTAAFEQTRSLQSRIRELRSKEKVLTGRADRADALEDQLEALSSKLAETRRRAPRKHRSFFDALLGIVQETLDPAPAEQPEQATVETSSNGAEPSAEQSSAAATDVADVKKK